MSFKYKKESNKNLFSDSYNEEEALEDGEMYYDYEEEISDESEEEFEEEEGFTSLQQPYFYGSTDLKNMRNIPTLLGEVEKESLLRLSYLR